MASREGFADRTIFPKAITAVIPRPDMSCETTMRPPLSREARKEASGMLSPAIHDDADGVLETAVARDDDETAAASKGEDGGLGDVTDVRDDTNGVLHWRCDTEGASIARQNCCVRSQPLPRKARGAARRRSRASGRGVDSVKYLARDRRRRVPLQRRSRAREHVGRLCPRVRDQRQKRL